MVAMNSTFDNNTPHGGPPFQGWKQGHGFGKAKGPGGYASDPSIPTQLKSTPGGDRCFANSRFWRSKSEVGLAQGFGIGDRPDYGKGQKDVNVCPAAYGDISRCIKKVGANCGRTQTLKPRFPSMEEKYRDLSWPKAGPGPGKYDTRIPPGQGSWKNPVAAPSWSMGGKPMQDNELRLKTLQAGPAEYDTRAKAGKHGPIRVCTARGLYDISLKSRTKLVEPGDCSPGPARYSPKGAFDDYRLIEKIMNCKVPKKDDPHNLSGTFQPFSPSGSKGIPRSPSSPI